MVGWNGEATDDVIDANKKKRELRYQKHNQVGTKSAVKLHAKQSELWIDFYSGVSM
jgi:hypothetical protein